MKVNEVNENGEVFVFPGPYSFRKKTALDYSNVFEDVFEEIPPYSVDVSTGELLNKTPDPIKKKVGVRNVQEFIQSFADEVDIYKILERVAISGDTSFLNRKVGHFGDFVNLPDNLNDFNQYVKKVFDDNSNLSPDILGAALNSALSKEEIQSIISKHVEQAIASMNKNNISEVKE